MRFESHDPRSLHATAAPRAFGVVGLPRSTEAILSPDALDLDSEMKHWRGHYRGLVDRVGLRLCDYEPALKLGLDAYMRGHGRSLDEMEEELRACYKRVRGASKLDWDEARSVVAAAYARVHRQRHAQ